MIRAMIVDDEAPARDRMRRLLEALAVTVVGEAEDGDGALESIPRLSPDVVFLDIQMPGCSGLEVAGRLAAPRPRLVFCTAFDRFAIDAFEHHAVDYLLKPVGRDRLARTVERLSAEIGAQRKLQREREEAASVQAKLMPAASIAGGLEFAGVCQPVGSVGGDYFDVLHIRPEATALAVGDVAGKGVYAGILAAAVQARMQMLAAHGEIDPAWLLGELNRMTVGTLEAHRYVTVALAVHDAASSTVTFASAGHPPALVIAADGRWRAVDAPGSVIGWEGGTFSATRHDVASGDLVVMFSDGFSEATSPNGEELGATGLAEIMCLHRSAPLPEIVSAALAGADRFSGGARPLDDRTLLVARIL